MPDTFLTALQVLTNSFGLHNTEIGIIIIFTLQMKKMRHRELKKPEVADLQFKPRLSTSRAIPLVTTSSSLQH